MQELERAKLSVDFAKFGFAGTLAGAIIGLIIILGLALLNACTPIKIETWALLQLRQLF